MHLGRPGPLTGNAGFGAEAWDHARPLFLELRLHMLGAQFEHDGMFTLSLGNSPQARRRQRRRRAPVIIPAHVGRPS